MKTAIIVILALVIVLGGGYFVYQKFLKKSNVGLPSFSKLNPDCKYNDPDLCKFINGWKEVKYYTVTSNGTINGTQSRTIMKIDGATKTQMTAFENDQENFNIITIGDTTFTKDYSDNKWWKQTSKPEDTTALNEAEKEFQFDDAEDQTTYKKMGKEACGTLTCFKYQVIEAGATDPIQYIYFDDKAYQLRKTRIESKDGQATETTIDYSKVTITEPSPIKEGSPYQGTTPTTGSTPAINPSFQFPSESDIQSLQDSMPELPSN